MQNERFQRAVNEARERLEADREKDDWEDRFPSDMIPIPDWETLSEKDKAWLRKRYAEDPTSVRPPPPKDYPSQHVYSKPIEDDEVPF